MRLVVLATIAAVLAVPVFAAASQNETGEEAQKIDLSVVHGPTLYLACSVAKDGTRSHDLASPTCGVISLWEQTNVLSGLQTSIFAYGGKPWDPDTNILP